VTPAVVDGSARVARVRFVAEHGEAGADAVAVEEPLEIQLAGASLAVVMRTPGHDEELALGFLVTERVVAAPEQVLSVRHCRGVSDPDASENVLRVLLAAGVEVDLDALRRNLYASSSCGICGKATIANALASAPPLEDASRFEAAFFSALPQRLEAVQPAFAATGGLHAAGLFAADGELLVVREDVGRHNAVDKVIGWALRAGRLPLAGHALLVSGRISYELVQKARLTLVGFLRGRSFNVYGERSRVRGGAADAGR
jgi:FdhD protein